jgi:hypothetical protein
VWLGTSLLYFRIHLILALAVCGLATQCALGLFLLVRSFSYCLYFSLSSRIILILCQIVTYLGFWMTADGYNGGTNRWVSFTDGADLINSDGQNHTISVYLSDLNTTLFGFEELNGLGDGDYNDGASPVLLIDSTVEAS